MLRNPVDGRSGPAHLTRSEGPLEAIQYLQRVQTTLIAHGEAWDAATHHASASLDSEAATRLRENISVHLRSMCAEVARVNNTYTPLSVSVLHRLVRLVAPLVARGREEAIHASHTLWALEPALMAHLRGILISTAIRNQPPRQMGFVRAAAQLATADVQLPLSSSSIRNVGLAQLRPDGLQAPFGGEQLPTLQLRDSRSLAVNAVPPMPAVPIFPAVLPTPAHQGVLLGYKIKWPRQMYQHGPLQDFTFSKVSLSDGRMLVKAATSVRGSFGKVADAIFSGGEQLVVKTIRRTHKEGLDKYGRPKTYAVPPAEAIAEYGLTVKIRGVIDAALGPYPSDVSYLAAFLRQVRPVKSPFVGYGVVNLEAIDPRGGSVEHTLMMMSRDEGDLFDVCQNVADRAPFELRERLSSALALSVVAQGLEELHHMHTLAGMAHLDLSSGNIFMTALGQCKLMDFGMALAIDAAGKTSHHGFRGSIISPEAALYQHDGKPAAPLSAATDVFALSTIAFEVAASHLKVANPFHGGHRLNFTEQPPPAPSEYPVWVMQHFVDWSRARLEPGTTHISARNIVQMATQEPFSAFFAPLCRLLPEVAELLLNRGMALEAVNRSNSQALLAQLVSITLAPTAELAQLMPYYQNPEAAAQRETVLAQLRIADVWERQQHARSAAQALRPGVPRPLPG